MPQYYDDNDYYSEPTRVAQYPRPGATPPPPPDLHRRVWPLVAGGAVTVLAIAGAVYAVMTLGLHSSTKPASTSTPPSAPATSQPSPSAAPSAQDAPPHHSYGGAPNVVTQDPQTVTQTETAAAPPPSDAPPPSTVTVTPPTDSSTIAPPTETVTQTVIQQPQQPHSRFVPRQGGQ